MSKEEAASENTVQASEALALGALEAGVRFATGYPGSPATTVMDSLLALGGEDLRLEWASNERSAFDAAFGASLAGMRALLCLKGVGLNVALDSLMVANLAGGDGGLVILVGDDPGAWSSQNEQDSRLLVYAAEVPLLEPTAASGCRDLIRRAFALAGQYRVPVVVRVTTALMGDIAPAAPASPAPAPAPANFPRQPGRFTVLPATAVTYHAALHEKLDAMREDFERSPHNRVEGEGSKGIIAAGFAGAKAASALRQSGEPPLRRLSLATLHPLPEDLIAGFLRPLEEVLVLEETMPFLETQVQAIAQRHGLTLPILGRNSGHVPRAGEVGAAEVVAATSALLPGWPWPEVPQAERAMPSRQALCDDCPYVPTFKALLAAMERFGGRERFIVTGEPGCMVRALLPPYQLLDVKYAMGSSIGLGAGLARAATGKRVVALSGDSALLHTGLMELVDTAQAGEPLLVVVLANETTALSGCQPHAASGRDMRGRERQPLNLEELVRAAGPESLATVTPENPAALQVAFEGGMAAVGVSVVIVRGPCPRIS